MKIGEVLEKAYNLLKEEEIESYLIDSQLLLCDVLKKDKLFIIMNRDLEISEEQEEIYFNNIEARKERVPIKYLLGECEFMGINFFIKKGVLIPRPDTEILVEEVIKEIKERNLVDICDVCCGSGAIGISIAKLISQTKVDLYDISETALEVTKENISRLDLQERASVQYSDLLQKAIEANKQYDVIVSNPPYIREEIIPTLMKDVKEYEPFIALSGGVDGLDFYRIITEESLRVLKNDGILAFEIGHDQKDDVQLILKEAGYKEIRSLKDLAGKDRVVIGIK